MANDIEAAARAEFEAWWDPHGDDYKRVKGASLYGVAFDAWKASRAALAAPASGWMPALRVEATECPACGCRSLHVGHRIYCLHGCALRWDSHGALVMLDHEYTTADVGLGCPERP